MTDYITEAVTWMFFAVNAGRVLAYLPQIVAAFKCQNGAVSVSRMTWGYFALAHFTAILYGLIVVHDPKMALVFLGNFIACCVLVGIVTWKKRQYLRQQQIQNDLPVVAPLQQRIEPRIGPLPSSVVQLKPRATVNIAIPGQEDMWRSQSVRS